MHATKLRKGEALAKMLKICVEKFDGHFDKAGMPYIFHLLKVMHYVKSDDEELQCIALGHDLVEDIFASDHEAGYSFLRREGFSDRVINGIRNLTKIAGEELDVYVERVKSSLDSIIVKLADLRHNSDIRRLKGLRDKDIERVRKYHWMHLELTTAKDAYGR